MRNLNLNYHTIDPMILQTLNLNQRRMNHILDILHGRPSNHHKQQLKIIKPKKNHFQNSLRSDNKQSNTSLLLPQISKRNQTIQTQRIIKYTDKKYSTLDKSISPKAKSLLKSQVTLNPSIQNQQQHNLQQISQFDKPLRKGKSQRKRITHQVTTPVSFLNFSKISDDRKQTKQNGSNKKIPRNSLSAVRNKLTSSKVSYLQSASMKQLSPSKQQQNVESIIEQQKMPSPSLITQKDVKKPYVNYRNKTKQLINDYMGEYTAKRSKSMQVLNPKDIYRLEIQTLIAELTPIQKLQQQQKKMKRIKRRHQHLKHFDHKYYSKLNQIDLITL